jgi:tetratricopeptide (TPR) repeat protein
MKMTESPETSEDTVDFDEVPPDQTPVDARPPVIPFVWRIVAVLGAVVIVVSLLLPVFNQRRQGSPGGPATRTTGTTSADVATRQTAVEADPRSATGFFELGNAHAASGQWSQAVDAYRGAIELDPNYLSAYANLGVAYYQLQDLEQAAGAYQQALAIDPNDADVTYNLGALYLQQALSSSNSPSQAELQPAIDQIDKAISLNPELAPPHFSLGVVYMTLRDTTRAIAEFEAFQRLDSGTDPEATRLAANFLSQLREAENQ